MDFHSTVIKHLDSIQTKDLESFLQTLSDQTAISVIMPNGRLFEGYEDVAALNKDWFADEDWSFNYILVKAESTHEMGYAVAEIDYHDLDQDGNAYKKIYYLTLLFKKLGNTWVLVHDQNTFTN
ncbi:nuclear transport factor 2 family protein [Virgibacillus necropolis]|uniref:YybH family protein n=1 Tax=Virgibacillus necropolis TaxID=163877 RepID=UPI00384C3324